MFVLNLLYKWIFLILHSKLLTMIRYLLLLGFSFFWCQSQAQLTLKKFDKTVVIEEDSYLTVRSCRNQDSEADCIGFRTVGKLIKTDGPTLSIDAAELSMKGALKTGEISRYFSIADDNLIPIVIPKNEILRIEIHKSKKSLNSKENKSVFGGLLFFTGMVTAANILVVKRESRNILGLSAGIQLGGAVLLAAFGNTKKYRMESEGGWRIE